jgi:hypothetical protein
MVAEKTVLTTPKARHQKEPGDFGRWLGAAMSDYGVTAYRLALERARARLPEGKRPKTSSLNKIAIDKIKRGERKATASVAWELGEALRACGVPWWSGYFALRLCGYGREQIALLEALDQESSRNGALMGLAIICEHYLPAEDSPEIACDVLADVWAAIGDETLKRAWNKATSDTFRPSALASIAFDFLDVVSDYDLTEPVRTDLLSGVFDLWLNQYAHFPRIPADDGPNALRAAFDEIMGGSK